ncbi:hypothetical protein M409DRAFT_55492 [Zasmidium cellare ATCC 36951]|uniref:Ecp2 effector protein domain-containing protein n=1 Tax=Zasmidium cellare ATCC 36951 TaxID=1080233 RepID=A0A6A6CEG0_ZASCE|nr:uncharacterized protein M409DRAFT_55492 [Zasmidium cellare ATCC 36951]KAF2165594.1 hypothetical protein M409DRAFT_55492 [Zasmidium cellare ATCC 36951]
MYAKMFWSIFLPLLASAATLGSREDVASTRDEQIGDKDKTAICTTDYSHPDYSPAYEDCKQALEGGLFRRGYSQHTQAFAKNDCTIQWVYETCGIAICGNHVQMWSEELYAQAKTILTSCPREYNGKFYVSGQMHYRDSKAGTWQIAMYNRGYQPDGPGDNIKEDLRKRRLSSISSMSNDIANDDGDGGTCRYRTDLQKRLPDGVVPGYPLRWVALGGTWSAINAVGMDTTTLINGLHANFGQNYLSRSVYTLGARWWTMQISTVAGALLNPNAGPNSLHITPVTPIATVVNSQTLIAVVNTLFAYWQSTGHDNGQAFQLHRINDDGSVGDALLWAYGASG